MNFEIIVINMFKELKENVVILAESCKLQRRIKWKFGTEKCNNQDKELNG